MKKDKKNTHAPSYTTAFTIGVETALILDIIVAFEFGATLCGYICIIIMAMIFVAISGYYRNLYHIVRDEFEDYRMRYENPMYKHNFVKSIPTCDLVRELEKREGVETTVLEPYDRRKFEFEGAAIILNIID